MVNRNGEQLAKSKTGATYASFELEGCAKLDMFIYVVFDGYPCIFEQPV